MQNTQSTTTLDSLLAARCNETAPCMLPDCEDCAGRGIYGEFRALTLKHLEGTATAAEVAAKQAEVRAFATSRMANLEALARLADRA